MDHQSKTPLYTVSKSILTLFLIAAILDGLLTRFGTQLGLYEMNFIARRNMEAAYLLEILVVAAYIGICGAASYNKNSTIYRAMSASINVATVLLWLAIFWNAYNILLALGVTG